ncbi:MAG: hypothetical protein ACYDBV_01705 [Nitrospiria bacterium]
MANPFQVKIVSWLVFILLSLGSSFSNPVFALPLFAKKYNLPCTACHEAFPKLNDVGIAFRDNGYQFGTDRDTPSENLVISPLSLRTTPIFTVQTQTNVPTDQSNSDTVSTGTFNLTGLDIHSAGVLAKNISYQLVLTPFLDNSMDLESAWVRFSNLFDSSWFNIKFGKHELDIPLSEKRSFGLSAIGGSYLVNHYHPGGSANSNSFEMGNNQYGIELSGHNKDSRIRYVIDVNNGSNPASNQAVGKQANVFTHLSVGFDQELVSERFGLLGDYGRWPTSCKTQGATTPGNCAQGTASLPGTGENSKPYSRFGGDLVFNLGSSGTPLASIVIQYLYGIDDGALIGQTTVPVTALTTPLCPSLPTTPCSAYASAGGSQDAVFHGGTIELNWMPALNTLIFGHYDRIFNIRQADPGMPSDFNDQTSVSLGIRYYIHISQFTLVALHGEVGHLISQKTNLVTGEDETTNIFFTGVDYVF